VSGDQAIFPEAVKEGLYFDSTIVPSITANFRILPDPFATRIRVQLSPGVAQNRQLQRRLHTAIERYVDAPFVVMCEAYDTFRSGMGLDYERKFSYLGR